MSVATNKKVIAIVLAAGSASRFGTTKQLVEVDGVAMVQRAVEVASKSSAAATAVVIGHDWRAVTAAITPFDGFLVHNERYAEGMGSSLALAVRATRHAADAVIVMLADQPLVTAAQLDALIDTWSGADDTIVASAYDGVRGPPALLPAACFDELVLLQGDAGARELLQDSRFTQQEVPFAAAAVDIDDPADLSRLQRNARN